LAQQTSPYLQQHADNPVDWYPWGTEALSRARAENKPLLLSIGYSACHWCHVMAHESFEDAQVAAAMNRLFVNVKVDREERPDLDRIYQLAHQMLSGRPGGWPLTVFLTADQVPFFAGTYYPSEPRFGLPGFAQLLEHIAAIWGERQADIGRQSASLLESFARMQPQPARGDVVFSAAPLEAALSSAQSLFDARDGGLGGAPKFPHAAELQLCLRRHAATGDQAALHLVAHTLERMAMGGIYDQLGGGFCRYSVDARWAIPHFEKMLYDNGPLLALYADAWCVTGSPLFERVVRETAAWTLREMQDAAGGYYSSLDADSEHEEGKFYVWTPVQVGALLSADEYAVASSRFGLDGPPNFEGKHWHLVIARSLESVAAKLSRPSAECAALLESARAKLHAARELRIHPGRDEKALVSWNALMIVGMTRAGRVFGQPEWIASARRAFDFIRSAMWQEQGAEGVTRARLLATSKDGRAHLNAYLDDYAGLLAAAIELLQAQFDSATLAFAGELARALLERFEDRDAGGFHFTSDDHEKLIDRSKPGYDDSIPSGNGVAALALNRLSFLTGETRYARAAERTLRLFYAEMAARPGAYSTLLMALEEQLEPTRTVILRGPAHELHGWRDALAKLHLPGTMVIGADNGMKNLPEVLAKPICARASAWVCEGATCLAPVSNLDELEAGLTGRRSRDPKVNSN
jgi:hypothetical protein